MIAETVQWSLPLWACHPIRLCQTTVRSQYSVCAHRKVAFRDPGWLRMHAGLSIKMNHEFSLSDLPNDLAAVLRDYDVDNSGSVSVAELVAGAQLMRQQAKKVRS